MQSSLSKTAKSFIPKSSSLKYNLISWNILSEDLTEAVYDSISDSGKPLFTKTFQQNRVSYLLDSISQYIKKYKHPIFCLQEVNDSHLPEHQLYLKIQILLQSHNYRVIYQSFGTAHPIYPELGIMTAIPLQYFDISDIFIKQIYPDFPNCFISVVITPKSIHKPIAIVNTHFPVKFYKPNIMKQLCESLHYFISHNHSIILCGDFNTTPDNIWFPFLQNDLQSIIPNSDITSISTFSTQRRDKRSKTNTIFSGRIDHVFFKGRGVQMRLLKNLPNSSEYMILPSILNPSDHFPLITEFTI